MRVLVVAAAGMTIILSTMTWQMTPAVHALQSTTPVAASTGTAEVTYTQLSSYMLPVAAVEYAGNHTVIVRWAVRDRAHFRIDLQTLAPALDTGTVTMVVNGATVTTYDTSTNRATVATLPHPARSATLRWLVPFLRSGMTLGGYQVPEPNPAQPISSYLALLRRTHSGGDSYRHIQGQARIIGQGRLLGHRADVIELHPLFLSSVGCEGWQNPPCNHRYLGTGNGKIWVDHDHPFILRFEQQSPQDVHNLHAWITNLVYRVTSVAYGQGPSAADLSYQPPVTPLETSQSALLPIRIDSIGPITTYRAPAPFFPVHLPEAASKLRILEAEGTTVYGPGLHPFTDAVDLLFGRNRYVETYYDRDDAWGSGRYYQSPYLLVQERIQTHGLPAGLQVGAPERAGTCQVWSGTYPDGQHWASFARGSVSLLVSTDALTGPALLRYVSHALCS